MKAAGLGVEPGEVRADEEITRDGYSHRRASEVAEAHGVTYDTWCVMRRDAVKLTRRSNFLSMLWREDGPAHDEQADYLNWRTQRRPRPLTRYPPLQSVSCQAMCTDARDKGNPIGAL